MRANELLIPMPEGLYCPPGDFFIDPAVPVPSALVTHGHADHARAGHGAVLATAQTLDIMALRYGDDFTSHRQIAELGKPLTINGVTVTFLPAGHVLGSAQIIVEKGSMRIVVSGDYKRMKDTTCLPFEPVRCDVFITEATFGLPVFSHPDDHGEITRLLHSVEQFPERTHLVGAYALGKAQRVIRLLREAGYDKTVYLHGALEKISAYYQATGIDLGPLAAATLETGNKAAFAGAIVICPPSSFSDRWARRFQDPLPCFASGWMQIRQRARQRGVELPLILSDHADWNALTQTILETEAEEVWVTHGREEALVRWCELHQIAARPLHLVGFEEEAE